MLEFLSKEWMQHSYKFNVRFTHAHTTMIQGFLSKSMTRKNENLKMMITTMMTTVSVVIILITVVYVNDTEITVFTLSIRTLSLRNKLVLKFELVYFTTY